MPFGCFKGIRIDALPLWYLGEMKEKRLPEELASAVSAAFYIQILNRNEMKQHTRDEGKK